MLSKMEVERLRKLRERWNEELTEAAGQAKHYQEKKDIRNMTTALKNQADRAAYIRALDAIAFALGVSEAVRGNEERGTRRTAPAAR